MSVDVLADLMRVYSSGIPQDITSTEFGEDIAAAIAEIFRMAENEVSRLGSGARISTATGLFMDQHLKDHGLRRQDGETDDQARDRLSHPPQAVTPEAIVSGVEAIVGEGAVILIELPLHGTFLDREHCLDRNKLIGDYHGVVIVLIPEEADALASVTDAVRTKIAAGKIWAVLEYT